MRENGVSYQEMFRRIKNQLVAQRKIVRASGRETGDAMKLSRDKINEVSHKLVAGLRKCGLGTTEDPSQPRFTLEISGHRTDNPPGYVGHLRAARGRVMVSFGQGCEGEPLTRWREIERAIRRVRAGTRRGSLHANTNGSVPGALRRLVRAGAPGWNLQRQAAHEGLHSLRQDALDKMVAGQVSLDEVRSLVET